MRPLVVFEFLSVDGVMEGLGSADAIAFAAFERTTTAYLLGRRTYEEMAEHWPRQPETDPVVAHLNSTPKYVVSSRLSWPKWQNTQVLAGDLATSVNSLKSRGVGTVAVLGSAQLVRALVAQDLVDGYRLFVHPLLLGRGKRLFEDLPEPVGLRLVDHQAASGGLLILNYARQR